MSWLTDIAGRAEDLLNKVDQTAATALQNKNKEFNSKPVDNSSAASGSDTTYGNTFSTSVYSSPQKAKGYKYSKMIGNKSSYSPKHSSSYKKPESDDDKLLRFLNSPESLPIEQKKHQKSIDSTQSHESILAETRDSDNNDENKTNQMSEEENAPEPAAKSELLANEKVNNNAESSVISSSDCKNFDFNDVVDGESKEQVEKRVQYAEAEMKRMSKKLEHWNSQISSNDKCIRELKDRERDMFSAMDAKDSQLAVLKVRLQEADQELHAQRNLVGELKNENERMIKEHADSASFQNKTVEVLRDQLQQTETELTKTKESLNHLQLNYMNQRSKMEEEHRHLVESYTSLQKKWNDVNERNRDLLFQLKTANANVETLQQEYNDYKLKAQRILQTKEKLISNLKEGNFENDTSERFEISSALLNAEVDSIKQERDLLKEELRRSNEQVENYRYEVQELEKTSQNDLAAAQECNRMLKEQLSMEKVQREECHLLNVQLKEEVELVKDDLATTKNSFQSRLQDREIEIEKLRRQLTAKSLSTVTQDELESRLHALTENLIQKQTMVEALSTEKSSLILQLERLEQQLREAQNYGNQPHSYVSINNVELTDRKPKSVFQTNPLDSTLTRKMKRINGNLDLLSVRIAVFLRRYPLIRVSVLIYMLLLHFWVMIVLLKYEPEIHPDGYVFGEKTS